MSQSAYLPDAGVLDGLIRGLQPSSKPFSSRQKIPLPRSIRPGGSSNVGATENVSSNGSLSSWAPEGRFSVPPDRNLTAHQGAGPKLRPSLIPPEVDASLGAGLARAQSLEELFSVYAQWARSSTGAISVFITDSEGLSMVPSAATEDYLAVAGEISTTLQKLSQLLPDIEGGSTQLELLHPKIGGVRWIEVVGCRTDAGVFTVGLLLTEQLTLGWPTRLRHGLRQAVDVLESR